MARTTVRAHERVREGKHEHVRQHTRRVDGSSGVEEPNPEEYGEILEEQMEEENTNAEKKPENPRPESSSKPLSSTSKPEDRKKNKASEE